MACLRHAATWLLLVACTTQASQISEPTCSADECARQGPLVEALQTDERLGKPDLSSLLQIVGGAKRRPSTSLPTWEELVAAAELQPEDHDFLQLLGTSEGERLAQEAWRAMRGEVLPAAEEAATDAPPCKCKEKDWGGPRPITGTGPSQAWANQKFVNKVVPTDGIERYMNYAKTGSGIPADFQGIFWMDQHCNSSIANDPNYKCNMFGTYEVLASFGESTPGEPGTIYQKDTRCVTPEPLFGGLQWSCTHNGAGNMTFDFHRKVRNTLNFCYTDDTHVQIYQKMWLSQASFGTVTFGPVIARLLGYCDAGDGYGWTPNGLLDMSMVKTPWGWNRVTKPLTKIQNLSPLKNLFLSIFLTPPLWHWIKSTQDSIVGLYPMIQIVDGDGKRTKYYDEYLKWMSGRGYGGATSMLSVPETP